MNQQSLSEPSVVSHPARAATGLSAVHGVMTREQIVARLNVLTEAAKARMRQSDPAVLGAVGGAEIDFMTTEERAERHRLCLILPTQTEEAEAARARIQARIQSRKLKSAME